MARLWRRLTGGGLVWVTGAVLIAGGIVCLYLSDRVVHGWWQGTLEAFGVGFIVGGVVDVLAISGLNQAITADRRRETNREAESILTRVDAYLNPPSSSEPLTEAETGKIFADARDLLAQSGDQMDLGLRRKLDRFVNMK